MGIFVPLECVYSMGMELWVTPGSICFPCWVFVKLDQKKLIVSNSIPRPSEVHSQLFFEKTNFSQL